MNLSNFQQPTPTCPHCGHALTYDEMAEGACTPPTDLFALATEEGNASIACPACDADFWVLGGYKPHYTTAFSEEELS